ncbi:hypothetical protein PHYBLDRAFT_142747 [Phycomyces blakesleeanus NRRL 1555(-)]|uniref:Uncharacterized protein n=1 Tax=Phycomyces blakesleeanus (strain ATCC 8743b / DSM 1359 / FGSC 10004 / NBRC 33097 / NRRL 1555) TaxID=763407 RepID=A0A162PZF5_PHYB8|nr:hypothetical protein PHYBLDRAFT_142747 [Phycomyces blakesleeanus NRRL 1555(-)]OAD75746.1 hypothetical protein PHYBLDRAFT_142747 [Phycomyces blakesleeanus NRRL 1555(-)]|eukprot:XP_018293786.1 hypothetical protein PHYBLDRAFT_142747 [Phycomyces blakesleeanus NRRL 1555(-)]
MLLHAATETKVMVGNKSRGAKRSGMSANLLRLHVFWTHIPSPVSKPASPVNKTQPQREPQCNFSLLIGFWDSNGHSGELTFSGLHLSVGIEVSGDYSDTMYDYVNNEYNVYGVRVKGFNGEVLQHIATFTVLFASHYIVYETVTPYFSQSNTDTLLVFFVRSGLEVKVCQLNRELNIPLFVDLGQMYIVVEVQLLLYFFVQKNFSFGTAKRTAEELVKSGDLASRNNGAGQRVHIIACQTAILHKDPNNTKISLNNFCHHFKRLYPTSILLCNIHLHVHIRGIIWNLSPVYELLKNLQPPFSSPQVLIKENESPSPSVFTPLVKELPVADDTEYLHPLKYYKVAYQFKNLLKFVNSLVKNIVIKMVLLVVNIFQVIIVGPNCDTELAYAIQI